ncbi:hypothetical protein ANN_27690 [Periplaneta americana]|uniref:Uncharacterized protein n=1 Tax=Periplaneta americana TaxID=6978 RepID=A0ABQ8RV18_PERAM|nr:hypothetical protein ANN_27690 [Periplaneta americana]
MQLVKVYGPDVMSELIVLGWCQQFHDGRENMADEQRPGRPGTSTTEMNVEQKCGMSAFYFVVAAVVLSKQLPLQG